MTLEERKQQRKFKNTMRYAIYDGREYDLYLAIPDYEKLQRCFKLVFDKEGIDPPLLLVGKRRYYLIDDLKKYEYDFYDTPCLLLSDENGYYAIQGKFKGSKGLHKITLHRLAYQAFYEMPDTTLHVHHLDKNKRNNAASNLVALTEVEHSEVHGRDVRIPHNLFTVHQRRSLLNMPLARASSELAEEMAVEHQRATKAVDDSTMAEVELALQVPRLLRMLNAPATSQSITELISAVRRLHVLGMPLTVLEMLCEGYQEIE